MSDPKILPEDIPKIIEMRIAGNSFEYIADEWCCSVYCLVNTLRRAGYKPRELGIPDAMPRINIHKLAGSRCDITIPYAVPGNNLKHLVVMPLEEYLRLKKLEEV